MINALFVFLLISSVSFTSLTKLTKINRRELNFFRQGKPSDEMISNAIKRLERYSKENDIIYNVDVKSSKLGGLGEFANKDLKKGDLILSMPVSLTMSVLNPLIRDFCFKEIKLDLDYIYNQRICITYFIFKDLRSEDSTFKDIYTLLRTIDFSSFPIYYKEKEINLLKNSFFIEKINNYKKFIRHMWDNFDKKSKIPFGDFKDIFTVLDSHFIVVNVEGNFTYIGFLLDIFTNELTEKKGPTYKMVTDVKTKRVNMYYNQAIIKKGEEIYSQYSDDLGKLNLDDLLLTTGFTNNDVNIIPLRKLELRDENGNFLCYVTISRTENFGLKDYDIKIIKAVLESKGGSSDKLAVKLLKRMLRRYLNNYPTTIEQDEERLKDDKLTNNERNITKVLIEEKRSLKFYLDYLESIN